MSNALITNREVFEIAFNRSVSDGIIKPSQIIAAEHTWFDNIFDDDFVNDVRTNTENKYDDFIEKYIKPIVAWGVLYNNFDYISLNITDKGIIQMMIEGTANLVGRESRTDARNEIKNTIYILIERAGKYGEKMKKAGEEEFKNFNLKFNPQAINFYFTCSTITPV